MMWGWFHKTQFGKTKFDFPFFLIQFPNNRRYGGGFIKLILGRKTFDFSFFFCIPFLNNRRCVGGFTKLFLFHFTNVLRCVGRFFNFPKSKNQDLVRETDFCIFEKNT